MEIRIEQLKCLNEKGHVLARLTDGDSMMDAIFSTYAERFPNGEVHLVELKPEGLVSRHGTPGLRVPGLLEKCRRAMDADDLSKKEGLFFEPDWPNHALLKEALPPCLQAKPCYLAIPLVNNNNKVMGFVQIFAEKSFAQVFLREEPLLTTLSIQASISLDNANHCKELERSARLKSELEIARGIQERFTPADPMIPGYKLTGIYLPANEVGGDYLDYFPNDFGDWIIVIADVCGKGIPAALGMTSLRSTIRAVGKKSRSSKQLLIAVNGFLAADLERDDSFITCLCIILEEGGSAMNFARAGHPKPIKLNAAGRLPSPLHGKGIALGMAREQEFARLLEEVSVDLDPGDKIVAYTDGLDEAMDSDRKSYGVKKLMALLQQIQAKPPKEIVEAILDDAKSFSKGHSRMDDMTILAIEKTGSLSRYS